MSVAGRARVVVLYPRPALDLASLGVAKRAIVVTVLPLWASSEVALSTSSIALVPQEDAKRCECVGHVL
eukprot:647921-Pyramimonas_sp.AAC.1